MTQGSPTTSTSLWEVAVEAPLNYLLTYDFSHVNEALSSGMSVLVPLKNRKSPGVLIQPSLSTNHQFEIKPALDIRNDLPVLDSSHLRWAKWIAQYYHYPLGLVLSQFFPPLEKRGKSKKKSPLPLVENTLPPLLTEEQQNCIKEINLCPSNNQFNVHLLFGVTGSGKTEVYLKLFEQALEMNQQGLFLIPEISLTPQLLSRFVSRFGEQIAVIHSHLTPREKTNQWWDMVEQRKKILIGARSALFCPLPHLGLIVLDEEHETSFKQDDKLRYHARDCAVMYAKIINKPIILGSATPSLETWQNTQSGKYQLHRMINRVENRALPKIQVIDIRQEKENKQNARHSTTQPPFWLSRPLQEALEKNLRLHKQSALFLNRRGVAHVLFCFSCGSSLQCPNCAISLTLHGKTNLVCHYCGYHQTLQAQCPSCKEGELKAFGLGTERIENDIKTLFPKARVARADRDEITNRQDLETLIERIECHEIDILIGTQMIAKGLDFENLTLVGLILADIGFNLPDFRSTERNFQLITQVSGRAGRHVKANEEPGQVIIQTYNPKHASIQFSKDHDFEGFTREELNARQSLNYPPFGKLAAIHINGRHQSNLQTALQSFKLRSSHLKNNYSSFSEIEILGPTASPLFKIKNKFRYMALIKSSTSPALHAFLNSLISNKKWLPPQVELGCDVDPYNLL